MKETRKANLIIGKSGAGSMTARVTLPTTWIKELGFTETEREAIIEINNDTITIKKFKEENEKDILLSASKTLLESLGKKETHGNRRASKKGYLNDTLTKLFNMGVDVDFVKNYLFVEKLKKYEKTDTMDGQVVVVYKNNYKFDK